MYNAVSGKFGGNRICEKGYAGHLCGGKEFILNEFSFN